MEINAIHHNHAPWRAQEHGDKRTGANNTPFLDAVVQRSKYHLKQEAGEQEQQLGK